MTDLRRMSPAETSEEISELVRSEGAATAFDAAMQMLRDPKTSSAARASLVATIFRAAGFFDKASGDQLDLSELDGTQLKEFLQAAKRELAAAEHQIAESRRQIEVAELVEDEPIDVFG